MTIGRLSFIRFAQASLLLLVVFGLIGCKAAAMRISGKVVQGTVGQVMVVGPADERLAKPGIPDVQVTVLVAGGSEARGKGLVGQATTDELGNFEFSIPHGQHPGSSVMVRVKGDWIFSARSQTYLPTNSQKLLCTAITLDGYVPPMPEDTEKE